MSEKTVKFENIEINAVRVPNNGVKLVDIKKNDGKNC